MWIKSFLNSDVVFVVCRTRFNAFRTRKKKKRKPTNKEEIESRRIIFKANNFVIRFSQKWRSGIGYQQERTNKQIGEKEYIKLLPSLSRSRGIIKRKTSPSHGSRRPASTQCCRSLPWLLCRARSHMNKVFKVEAVHAGRGREGITASGGRHH